MKRMRGALIALGAPLLFWGALLYLLVAGGISVWVPPIILIHWLLSNTLDRPKTGASITGRLLYQALNTLGIGSNLIVLSITIYSVIKGRYFQQLLAGLPDYWGSHEHMVGYIAEGIVIASAALAPIAAIMISGGVIIHIVRNEWYSSWRFQRVRSKHLKEHP